MFQVKRSSLLIALAVAGILAPSAKADEVTMQITRTSSEAPVIVPVGNSVTTTETRTVVEGTPSTVLVPGTSTVIVNGATVPLSISENTYILQTVDQRRAALDKAIVDARSSGTITDAQAAAMRREMDRIGSEVVYLKGQPSPSLLRAVVVAQDLDALTTNLRRTVTTVAFVPIIEGSHFTIFNGRIIQLDDLAVRRIGLENKILAAQAEGKITYDQANHMRSELNAIAAIEDAYKANNALNFKASKEIYKDMDKVANELDNAKH